MTHVKKKYSRLFFIAILASLTVLALIVAMFVNKLAKNVVKNKEPITINLLTSVHPSLPWTFKALDPKITVNPGEVITIEYVVENLKNKESTGIATFSYYPRQFENYIRKLNCFCYDAQTLKPNQKNSYSLVLLIDPEVTKDSKTMNIKEVTIQFNFFNYKEYKENQS